MTSPSRRFGAEYPALLLTILLAGCASQSRTVERLPFHIAIAPSVVRIDEQMASQQREGSATELTLSIEANKVTAQLAQSMSKSFMRVTTLPADTTGSASTKEWANKARAIGADLLLRPELRYAPTVHSSLNDRFWLNLPLFAIGGPFSWFVADRSYYCDTELAGNLIDVSVATADSVRPETVDDDAKVLEIMRLANEASLNFLDRADGAMPYVMSLVIPAGLVATESGGAIGSLDESVISQVSESMATGLLDSRNNITRWSRVSFYPRNVLVATVDGKRVLRGQLWLEPRAGATAVADMRHRIAGKEWSKTTWQEMDKVLPSATSKGRTTYEFEIPLAADFKGTMQLDVTQNDRFSSHRTFTYQLD